MKLITKLSLEPVNIIQNLNGVNSTQITDQFRKLSQLTDFGKFADEIESKWKKCEEKFPSNNSNCYKCFYCKNTYCHPFFVRQHLLVEHLSLEPERYECLSCGKIVTELNDHIEFHEKALKCPTCGLLSSNQIFHKFHRKQHEESVKSAKLNCDICNINCVTVRGLQIHKEYHEKHKDAAGNYIRLTPRVKRYQQEFWLTNSPTKTKKSAEISCGSDTVDSCVHFDEKYKLLNIYLNGKSCDTRDLAEYTNIDQIQSEPCRKKRKIVAEL